MRRWQLLALLIVLPVVACANVGSTDQDGMTAPPGSRGVELDTGTFDVFAIWQPGVTSAYPTAFAWAPGGSPREVWAMLRVGQPGGFQLAGAANPDLELEYKFLANNDFGDWLGFRAWVRNQYQVDYGMTVMLSEIQIQDHQISIH